jgi:hypothetical protein
MRHHEKFTAAFAAAVLLLTTGAAYAAVDVWVLWSKWDGSYALPNATYAPSKPTYRINAAYADRATCLRAIDAHLATVGSTNSPDGAITRVDTSELGDGKGSYWIEERTGKLRGVGVYVCLPDKVDPPGPKAR